MEVVGIFPNLIAHPIRPSYFLGHPFAGSAGIIVRNYKTTLAFSHTLHVPSTKAHMDCVWPLQSLHGLLN
jgi:hypothetical protein